jgi:hypothetical protein
MTEDTLEWKQWEWDWFLFLLFGTICQLFWTFWLENISKFCTGFRIRWESKPVMSYSRLFWRNANKLTTVRKKTCRSTRTHYSDSEPTILCSYSLMLEKQQIPILVFGLTRPGLEPTIYHTRGEHVYFTGLKHVLYAISDAYLILVHI